MNVLNKLKYWIRGFNKKVQQERKCKRCCIFCEYFDLCISELEE